MDKDRALAAVAALEAALAELKVALGDDGNRCVEGPCGVKLTLKELDAIDALIRDGLQIKAIKLVRDFGGEEPNPLGRTFDCPEGKRPRIDVRSAKDWCDLRRDQLGVSRHA